MTIKDREHRLELLKQIRYLHAEGCNLEACATYTLAKKEFPELERAWKAYAAAKRDLELIIAGLEVLG